jgi:Co/Zn/Cd efflux system component
MRQLVHAVSDLLEDKKEIFTCRICSKPLQLETDTRTDEDGRAVHEECYVNHVTAQARART